MFNQMAKCSEKEKRLISNSKKTEKKQKHRMNSDCNLFTYCSFQQFIPVYLKERQNKTSNIIS